MSGRVATLRRIHHVRQRLRDAAAGIAFASEARRLEEERQVEALRDRIERMIDESGQRMTPGGDGRVTDLLAFDEARARAECMAADAARALDEAAGMAELARSELIGRERELRTVEKLIDRVRVQRATRQRKQEQRLVDDTAPLRAGRTR